MLSSCWDAWKILLMESPAAALELCWGWLCAGTCTGKHQTGQQTRDFSTAAANLVLVVCEELVVVVVVVVVVVSDCDN